MSLAIGNTGCTTGMSKRIYDALVGGVNTGFSPVLTGDQQDSIKAICFAVAKGVVDEITTNGQAVISAATGALQQVSAADTDPPTAERTLPLR